jgi:regulatory protein
VSGRDAEPGRARRSARAATAEEAERDPVAAAREAALRLLTVRARSRAELERRLGQRELPQEAVTAALDRLEAVGLVDDAAFAKAYAESRAAGGMDAAVIARDLRSRGVAPDLAARAIGAAVPADEQAARCRQVAEVRLARLAGLRPEVQFRRLAGYLDRRGYPAGLIDSVVSDLVTFEDASGATESDPSQPF